MPAPAETKTVPLASTAASCSSFRRRALGDSAHDRGTRQIGQRSHQAWTAVALRVVLHVTGADALRVRPRALARRLDLCPERLLVQVVVLGEARAGPRARTPGASLASAACPRAPDTGRRAARPRRGRGARGRRAGSAGAARGRCPVPSARLSPTCSPARCPRALNGSMSIRSIFPESRSPSPRSSPRWSSGAARSDPNATSSRRGTNVISDAASSRTNPSRSRDQRLAQLRSLEVGEIEPHARLQGVVQAGSDEERAPRRGSRA